jgi:hypothetical protein
MKNIGMISLVFLIGFIILPVFAQTTTDSISANVGNWFNSAWDMVGQQLSSITGSVPIPPNPMNLTSGKLQAVTNSGFNVATKLKDVGVAANDFTSTSINSFSPFVIPAIIVTIVSIIVTLFFLRKMIWNLIKHLYLVVGIIIATIFVLFYVGVQYALAH